MKGPEQPFNGGSFFPGGSPLRVAGSQEDNQAILLDNEAMIRQIIGEDPEKGFSMIFRKYYVPLCNHAARFVFSREVAEDIVSEVFLSCWKKKLFLDISSTFRAYLYTAVRNAAFNYLKKELIEKIPEKEEGESPAGLVEGSDPQTILLLQELAEKIEKTIEGFPPQRQKVFLMSRFEGKKNREIASAMNIGLKTVEAHMMKALATLKKSLSAYLNRP